MNYGGSFATSALGGTIGETGGTLNITGNLNNALATLNAPNGGGDYTLLSGTITGGTVSASGALIAQQQRHP